MKVRSLFLFVFILNLTTHLFAQNIEKNKILIIGQFDRPDERYAIEVTLTELFSKQGLMAIPSLNILKQGSDPLILASDTLQQLLLKKTLIPTSL